MRAFARHPGIFAAVLLACFAHATAAELPRVMILGDEAFQGMAGQLSKTLKDKAVVVHISIPEDLPPTAASAVAAFDRLAGKEKWGLIYFSFGLGELMHRAPGMKSFRVLAKSVGGIPSTSPEEYEKNLDALAQKLSKTGARLIWSSIPPFPDRTPEFWVPGSEVAFNQRASAIMARHRIPVNDLHAFALSKPDAQRNRQLLLAPIAEIISRELKLK